MPTQRRTPSLMSQAGSSPNRYSSSNLLYNPQGRIPLRSTLKTEKLVLIPEEDEGNRYKARTGVTTNAELNKDQRSQVPRVTSYCIAKHFDLDKIQAFVKHSHGIKSRRFDDCLYFSYDELSKEMLFGKPNSIIPVPFGIMGTSYNTNENSLSPNSKSLPQRIGDYRNPRPEFTTRGEAFIFDYGVIVLWNFTLDEEAEFISHLSPYGSEYLDESDICIEDLHFQYDDGGPVAPKVYNDMITLKGNSPLIKLTISHGISQSVMLSLFENIMGCAIEGNCRLLDAAPLPHMLAKEGDVFMDRVEIMKTIGKLYDLKMNVNLISSVLDTPEMIWFEPGLEGHYDAIRQYFEISQRADLLNSRADVLNDLLSMLSDHLNSSERDHITWIVIVLICIACIVAIAEVMVKLLEYKISSIKD